LNHTNLFLRTVATIASFFGAEKDSTAPGGWKHVPERIPDDWFNRRTSYTLDELVVEILALFTPYPKPFGGNVGTNNFNDLTSIFGIIKNGELPDTATAADVLCLLYQVVTENVPASLTSVTDLTQAVLDWTVGKLNPVFRNSGCVLKPDGLLK
jgi:hypothetical protein